eukprot:12913018-Prorocentrum_lima.AAC.1
MASYVLTSSGAKPKMSPHAAAKRMTRVAILAPILARAPPRRRQVVWTSEHRPSPAPAPCCNWPGT